MSFDPMLVREIRQVYTEDYLDFSEPQTLKDLCESRGVSYKTIKEIADRENWEGLRYKNKETFNRELAKQQDEMIKNQALDVSKTIENTVKHNLVYLAKQLPRIKSKLEDRIEDMTTKELLAFLRLLIQLEKETISILEKAAKSAGSGDNDYNSDIIEYLKNPSDFSRLIEGIGSDNGFVAEDTELQENLRKFDG